MKSVAISITVGRNSQNASSTTPSVPSMAASQPGQCTVASSARMPQMLQREQRGIGGQRQRHAADQHAGAGRVVQLADARSSSGLHARCPCRHG